MTERYIEQVEKKPVYKYTPKNILKKRKKRDDWKDRVAFDRQKKLVRQQEKYRLQSSFKNPQEFIDAYKLKQTSYVHYKKRVFSSIADLNRKMRIRQNIQFLRGSCC